MGALGQVFVHGVFVACVQEFLAEHVGRELGLDFEPADFALGAIEAAITDRTRLVIVNTPHNPTGRIYDAGTLTELAAMLDRASARIGRRIVLLSDEPYRRLRFDGNGFTGPAAVYRRSPAAGPRGQFYLFAAWADGSTEEHWNRVAISTCSSCPARSSASRTTSGFA